MKAADIVKRFSELSNQAVIYCTPIVEDISKGKITNDTPEASHTFGSGSAVSRKQLGFLFDIC